MYLDRRGLVALWREGLLAQAVLRGATRGYRHHPQLTRFSQCRAPVSVLASYLRVVHDEASHRGYTFRRAKVARTAERAWPLTVTRAQLAFEWSHLLAKVAERDVAWWRSLARVRRARPHPMFTLVDGPVAEWERGHLRKPIE